MNRLMMAVAALAMVGCSGSMNGTVGGVSLNVADAIFAVLKDDSGKSFAAIVAMSDKPKMCETLKANREVKSSTLMVMTMFRYNSGASEFLSPDVGEYTVVDSLQTNGGNFGNAGFTRNDSDCRQTVAATASRGKSGLIKLTGIKAETNGNANGTFDITFGAGDKVTGNFNATFCDITKLPTADPNCE